MPSAMAFSLGDVNDVKGDNTLVRPNHELLEVSYTDITSAWARPAFDYPAIEFGVALSSPIPDRSPHDFNLFFFLDIDRDALNNDQAGTRAGADRAYSLMYASDVAQWRTVSWSYDSESDEWLWEEDPRVLFGIYPERIIMHVPPEYFPEGYCPAWRAAIAASDGKGATNGDTLPDGTGELIDGCDLENEPVVVSGLNDPYHPPEETIKPAVTTEKDFSWWSYLAAALFLGGGMVLAGRSTKKNKKAASNGCEDPEPKQGEQREKKCCHTCSMFVSVGDPDDVAVRSAANLGMGIRRDTERSMTTAPDDKCLKVAHFHFDTFEKGRRLVSDGQGGKMDIVEFNTLNQYFKDENHDDIDLWKEVMIVNHGEKALRVKNIMRNFTRLIPKKPVLKVVFYYCGGGRTLPDVEFKKLARELGRRLKDIPEECNKHGRNEVEIYLAPTVGFCKKRKKKLYTRLSLDKNGLISFEGKMTKYTVTKEGTITCHGNIDLREKPLFGKTKLGILHSNAVTDANAYYEFWGEVCCLKYSEIQKRRQIIKENMKHIPTFTKPPTICLTEKKANLIQADLRKAKVKELTDQEMDNALDCNSSGEFKKYLKSIR